MGSMGYPKIVIFIYVHGENDWELRTFCSQASNLKPLGTGQPGAC